MKILKTIIKPFSLLDKYEKWFVLIYFLTLVLGIWHALPNFNVVGDESQYVVGVLQAFKAHTIIPDIIYPYTLSWYLSYLFQIPFLATLLIFLHGSIPALEHFLIYNQEIIYYVPRFMTVFSCLYLVSVFFLLARQEHLSKRHKYIVAFLTFTNILFVFISHTGKMWILSLLLFVVSFYFLDKTLRSDSASLEKLSWRHSPLFYAVLFPFLAMSNFAINIIALVNIAVLLIVHYKNKILLRKIIKFSGFGILIFGVFFLLNMHGWLTHGSMAPVVQGHHIFDSLKFLTLYTFYTFPFLLFLLVFSLCKTKSINLKIKILVIDLIAYVILIIIVAPWASLWPQTFLRYLLYPGFIISLMLLYVDIKIWKTSYIFVFLSILFFLKTIYLLMIPTTYNLARTYIIDNAQDNLVVNNLFEVNLPKNQASYGMIDPQKCETECEYVLEHQPDKSEPGLFVIDSTTKKDILDKLSYDNAYIVSFNLPLKISSSQSLNKPVFISSNSLTDNSFISIEHNLGEYSLDFIKVARLGQPIYVYHDLDTN